MAGIGRFSLHRAFAFSPLITDSHAKLSLLAQGRQSLNFARLWVSGRARSPQRAAVHQALKS